MRPYADSQTEIHFECLNNVNSNMIFCFNYTTNFCLTQWAAKEMQEYAGMVILHFLYFFSVNGCRTS